MSKNELDKILDKVRKLLALAGNNSNQHEAASAAEMAARILDEYNLTLTDVEVREIVECAVKFNTMNTQDWYGMLAVTVANVFDCYVFKRVDDTEKNSRAVFVGTRSDAEVASYVYMYLFNVCTRLIKKAVDDNQTDSDNRMSRGKARKAYSYGLVNSLEKRIISFYGKRCKENEKVVGVSGKSGKELMVIKENAIDKYLNSIDRERNYKKTKIDSVDTNLFERGITDANGISLTYGIKSSGRKTEGYLTRG